MTKDLRWPLFHRVQPGCSSRTSRWLQNAEAWWVERRRKSRNRKKRRKGRKRERMIRGEGGREGISLQKHISSDLLPPVRLHLLKFSKPLKTAAPPSVQYMSPVETFHI